MKFENSSRVPHQNPDPQKTFIVFEFERRAYPINEVLTIGRGSECDVIVREPAVSRCHAEIRLVNNSFELHPVGATGTRVNRKRLIDPVQLMEGDRIEVGSAVLTFTQLPLPLGVSIVDNATPKKLVDVGNRRPTITRPILNQNAPAVEVSPVKKFRPVLLALLALVIGAAWIIATF